MGAHYDSPDDFPGANDNGPGVAALLEIARHLSRPSDTFVPARGIHLVFFVNEELPFKAQNVPVKRMIALETLGYFSDAPGTQNYPQSFGLIYR
ncbi:MAG: M28 family peptidase [Hyphomicrobiaceae bacterium]